MLPIRIHIDGQCPSGKNAVQINPKTGRHYPNARFKEWKEAVSGSFKGKVSSPIDEPLSVIIDYKAADFRRRDVPGIIDALWHVLEKVGNVVKDDSLLGGSCETVIFKNHGKTAEPGVDITLYRGNFEHNTCFICGRGRT